MAEIGYGCVFGDCATQPNHLVTTMTPAVTLAFCDEHYPAGLIPLLAAELGVDPGPFYSHVEKYIAREHKKAEKAQAEAETAMPSGDDELPDHYSGYDDGDAADDQGGMSEVYGRSAPDGGEPA